MGLLMVGVLAWADATPAHASTEDVLVNDEAAAESGSSGWGPIVGGCLGVLFGGGLAVWQIRSMANRD